MLYSVCFILDFIFYWYYTMFSTLIDRVLNIFYLGVLTMETKQFKAESKRLLEMMIHSIYTHREIFLRELISNASDAIDKLYFNSLKDGNVGVSKDTFQIKLAADKNARTLTITDNGIGMTKDELENNLGTIAQSGSLKFKNDNNVKDDVEIIGQFGVGFYSAFMVAKQVEVTSKAFGSDKAYCWKSEGVDGYTIDECDKESSGTTIVLTIKDNTDDDRYDEFLDTFRLKNIVKKYSDYIRYPIKMDVEHQKLKDGSDKDYETIIENETLNSMVPIWRKNKNELTEEDYNNFYMEKFNDYQNPAKYIHTKAEGISTYDALLYIPSSAPFDYFTKDFQKGLQLYSNGVLIMEKCADLLPDYFGFVRGLVDSADLSLNISREILQHDRQLKHIANNLQKTIKNELLKMQKNEREKYDAFFKNFGITIKYGVYSEFGANKETLKDLLMFSSSFSDKPTTLAEYVSRMKEDQKFIYYATGESTERIKLLPQTEAVMDKGYEILYFTDDVDEFAIRMLEKYDEKEFKSVSADDLDIETKEEKDEIKKQEEDNKDIFSFMQDVLKDKVKAVRLSNRLKTHPVCLSSDGTISMEMEKVLNNMPSGQKVSAQKVLEINPNHPIVETLKTLYNSDKDKLTDYAKLLYTQALLIEGLPIEDPVEFSNSICKLMTK